MGSKQSVITHKLPRGIRIRRHASNNESLQIAFTYKGKECRETLRHMKANASGIAEAVRRLERINTAIGHGNFDYGREFPQSRRASHLDGKGTMITVSALMDEWLNKKKQDLTASTFAAYQSMIETRIKPGLGDKLVRDLTLSKVIGWLGSGDLRGLSLKYVRNLMTPLRRALYFAAREEYIDNNPIPKQDLDLKSEVPKEYWGIGNKADPLNRSEVASLLAACPAGDVRNLFNFAFETGLRTGELIGLRWADVNFERKEISVRSTVVKKAQKTTKTPKGTRTVDLSAVALDVLNNQFLTTRHKARVFCHPDTQIGYQSSHEVYDLWKFAITKAKLRYRAPRQTRHTYASTRISEEPNLNLFYLADQLGHEGTDMINHHYGKYIRQETSTSGSAKKPRQYRVIPATQGAPDYSMERQDVASTDRP